MKFEGEQFKNVFLNFFALIITHSDNKNKHNKSTTNMMLSLLLMYFW